MLLSSRDKSYSVARTVHQKSFEKLFDSCISHSHTGTNPLSLRLGYSIPTFPISVKHSVLEMQVTHVLHVIRRLLLIQLCVCHCGYIAITLSLSNCNGDKGTRIIIISIEGCHQDRLEVLKGQVLLSSAMKADVHSRHYLDNWLSKW